MTPVALISVASIAGEALMGAASWALWAVQLLGIATGSQHNSDDEVLAGWLDDLDDISIDSRMSGGSLAIPEDNDASSLWIDVGGDAVMGWRRTTCSGHGVVRHVRGQGRCSA
jgi:hypothetical protein